MLYTDKLTICVSRHGCLRIAHLKAGYCCVSFVVLNGKGKMQFVQVLQGFSHFSVSKIIVDFSTC